MYTNDAHGRLRPILSRLPRSTPQYAPKRSHVARDLYELQNGWVRTFSNTSQLIIFETWISETGTSAPENNSVLLLQKPCQEKDMLMPKSVQLGRIDRYSSILPVQIAASRLESFYNVVIDSVRHKWVHQAPVNTFTIAWKNIELEFSSHASTIPVRPLSVSFPYSARRSESRNGLSERFEFKCHTKH